MKSSNLKWKFCSVKKVNTVLWHAEILRHLNSCSGTQTVKKTQRVIAWELSLNIRKIFQNTALLRNTSTSLSSQYVVLFNRAELFSNVQKHMEKRSGLSWGCSLLLQTTICEQQSCQKLSFRAPHYKQFLAVWDKIKHLDPVSFRSSLARLNVQEIAV